MPVDNPTPVPKPRNERCLVPGPTGPLDPPYRDPGPVTNAVPAARWRSRTGPPAAHTASSPSWTWNACGRDWPCPALRAAPTEIPDRHPPHGWAWIECYQLDSRGLATAKRELFVLVEGVRQDTAPPSPPREPTTGRSGGPGRERRGAADRVRRSGSARRTSGRGRPG